MFPHFKDPGKQNERNKVKTWLIKEHIGISRQLDFLQTKYL